MFEKLGVHLTILLMCVGLAVSPSSAQDNAKKLRKQEERQARRDLKAAEQRRKDAERQMKFREEVQPEADRYAKLMSRLEHRDPVAQVYINSLGQSLVPNEFGAAVTFSFRVIYEHHPNAFALPDGRIYVTTGLLASIENEAQLAVVLGHEIAHVTEEHIIDKLRRRKTAKRRKLIITALGAGVGSIIGAKAGEERAKAITGAITGAAAGAAVGLGVATLVDRVLRSKFNPEQEKEDDLIGCELAMARGFDPEEGRQFFSGLHDRYGGRPPEPLSTLMSGIHPPAAIRAFNISAILTGELSQQFQSRMAAGEIATGSGRFGRMLSAAIRDNGILLAERSDRYDLALENLERAQRYRPNDPRLLWALGRVYRMVGRTQELRDKAENMLIKAIQADQRHFYPAIHRDLAYLQAASRDDYTSATENLEQYVLAHIATHSTLPSDLEQVYDQLVLFGDNAWTPYGVGNRYAMAGDRDASPPVSPVYKPEIWDTPGDGIPNYEEAVGRSGS